MKNIFRIVAFLEGVSYILLLFIAVPIKYWGGDEQYVKLLGKPHGILFICYIIMCFIVVKHKNLNGSYAKIVGQKARKIIKE